MKWDQRKLIVDQIRQGYKVVEPYLMERAKRVWAVSEALSVGYGGVTIVCEATGISRATINKGKRECDTGLVTDCTRVRREGGGRKKLVEHDPKLLEDLDELIDPGTRGDPQSPDTAEFAVESIRRWWRHIGVQRYPKANELLITADGGGSNGYRIKLWKREIQSLSNELHLRIQVCHFPPGTSKWNKIEHRMFSFVTKNWRGRPLDSLASVVNLIADTTTDAGLHIEACIDENNYEKGIQISDEKMETLYIELDSFQGSKEKPPIAIVGVVCLLDKTPAAHHASMTWMQRVKRVFNWAASGSISRPASGAPGTSRSLPASRTRQ